MLLFVCIGEMMEKAGKAFSEDGKVGKQFTEDGKVGTSLSWTPFLHPSLMLRINSSLMLRINSSAFPSLVLC